MLFMLFFVEVVLSKNEFIVQERGDLVASRPHPVSKVNGALFRDTEAHARGNGKRETHGELKEMVSLSFDLMAASIQ